MQEINKLIAEISKISVKHQNLTAVSGSNFNVFKVINLTTNEVRLHSKFVAELLNPKGSHGQEDVFLRLFTDKFKIAMHTKSASVEVEKHIGKKTKTTGGYIDIFIKDKNRTSITIENKIYARDQENQLLRYYNYNKNNIFYLTLFGDEPTKYSYELDQENKIDLDKEIQLISYKEDIKDWLIACRKEAVEFPLLREGISHYINLIESLTGQTSNDIMNKEIRDYISSNEETLKQASLISENLTAAKIKIQWLFWQSLKEKLEQSNIVLIEEKNVSWQNVNSYYKNSRNRDRYYGFWSKIFEKENITIHLGIELEDQLYYGFTLEENQKGGVSNKEKFSEYKDCVLEMDNNYKNNQYWLGWKNSTEKLDFRAFNSDAIFELADRKKLDKKVNALTLAITKDVKSLKLLLARMNK